MIIFIDDAAPAAGVSHVGSESAASGGATVTVNKPTGVADGDLLILVHICGNQTRTVTSAPVASSPIFEDVATANGVRVYARVASSEPSSYSLTLNSANNQVMSVHAYRGVSAADVIGTFTRGDLTASGITVPASDGVLMGLFQYEYSGGTPAVDVGPSGMDFRTQNSVGNVGQTVFDKVPSVAGATGDKTLTIAAGSTPSDPSALLIHLA